MKQYLFACFAAAFACCFFGPGSDCSVVSSEAISGGQMVVPVPIACTEDLSNVSSTACTGPGICTAAAVNDYSGSWFGSEDITTVALAGCPGYTSGPPPGGVACGGPAGELAVAGCIVNW